MAYFFAQVGELFLHLIGRLLIFEWQDHSVTVISVGQSSWLAIFSPHARETGMRENFACGIRSPGVCNPEYAQEIRNPTNDWNPESKFYRQILKSSTWNPESKTILDSLIWSESLVFTEATK